MYYINQNKGSTYLVDKNIFIGVITGMENLKK